MTAAVTPGEMVGRYRVESLVGRGGMGVVYRATDVSLERPVALKLIAPELAEDERFRGRFLKESRLAASLDHPNVVPIYESGDRDGRLYLAMRYVEGSDLRTVLQRERRLTAERAIAVLAQVAGALDAAHRRGLVHRDVKPANVLLDADEHAYLTDFGITKQLGGASTETGRIVGTLDYLAPEQIRGDAVDGRTDCYALGCVLFECLAGEPPFRRPTEAETLWAHMQERPPALPGHPALDPVLHKALAKEKEARHDSCAALIADAGAALGLAAPTAGRKPRAPRTLIAAGRRHPLAVAFCGFAVLAAVIAALVVAGESGSRAPGLESLAGNSLAAIDTHTQRVVTDVSLGGTPTSVAIGAGFVWALDADDQTIARLDPRSRRVRTFGLGATPTALATGGGELWVESSQGFGSDRLLRIGADDLTVRDEVDLPRPGHQGATGLVQPLAVGRDAVWAINGGEDLARVDRRSGRVAVVRRLRARAVAADGRSVWALAADEATLVRIDARTAAVRRRVRIPATRLDAVAAGAGAVWAADAYDGTLWRIEPGRRYITRTIAVGKGADGVAVGAGSVWVINSLRGTLIGVDPRSNRVVRNLAVGNTPRGIAIGTGSVWVTLAGGAAPVPAAAAHGAGAVPALPPSACGRVLSAPGATPDYLIASDLPLRAPPEYGIMQVANATEFVLRQRGFRAGRYRIGYQSCDDSTADSAPAFDQGKCAANAKAYAADPRLVGVVGPYNSGCALVELPILNAAKPGPVAMISPTSSAVGLTHRDILAPRNELAGLYPTGVRNYARVVPPDDAEAAADALLARRLGLRHVYVLDDRGDVGREFAAYFRRSARAIGLGLAGSAHWDPAGSGFDALAEHVRRAGADGVFLAGISGANGGPLVRALRSGAGSRLALIGANPFGPADFVLESSRGAAKGMYISVNPLPRLSARGRQFERDFQATQPGVAVRAEVGYAAAATAALLDAIARSDGTRASVARELLATRESNGILGPLRFDRNGDPVAPPLTIMRIVKGGGVSDVPDYTGAAIDRVITPPPTALR